MWELSPEMISNIRRLDLCVVLRSWANVDDVKRLLRVIERTNFQTLSDDFCKRCEVRSLAPGRRVKALITYFIIRPKSV